MKGSGIDSVVNQSRVRRKGPCSTWGRGRRVSPRSLVGLELSEQLACPILFLELIRGPRGSRVVSNRSIA